MAQSKGHKRRCSHNRKPKPRFIDRTEAEVTGLGLEGDGTVLVEGKPAHVPFTIPGEQVAVKVEGSRGQVLELLKTSSNRQLPLCKHFGDKGDRCGGCALQHLDTDYYRAWKQGIVRQALAREGFADVEVEPIISSMPGTRRRAGFALQKVNGKVVAGFHEKQTHRLISLEACSVLHPDLFAACEVLCDLTEALFAENHSLKLTAHTTLCENGLDIDLAGLIEEAEFSLPIREALATYARNQNIIRITINEVPFYQKNPAIIHFVDVPVSLPPRAFLQATQEGQEVLQHLVREAVGKAARVADLFAGCGTFTFALAAEAHVYAVESVAPAIATIEQAENAPGLKAITTEVRDLFRQPLMPPELAKFDAVIFDPPRAGAEAQVIQIAASSVPLVIGISCNPKTFARDARLLREGGYHLLSVQPVDQFLFSPHIELVGVFRRS